MIAIVGVKQTGKSTYARELWRVQAARGPCYALDIFRAYRGEVRRTFPLPRAARGRPVVYRPPYGAWTPELSAACGAFVKMLSVRGGTGFIDEVGAMRGPDATDKAPDGLGRIAVQGAHPPCAGAVLVAQRFQFIWPVCRTDLELIVAFRQTAGLDVDLLLEAIPRHVRHHVALIVSTLPDFHYLYLKTNGAEIDLSVHGPLKLRKVRGT